ncbi:MAG: dihydrofolate reductase family protein, partial [Marinobacter sp.]|nr:dihydrofolate reductase family protein [Marinobacter sp.]
GISLTGVAWKDNGIDLAELLDSLGELGINELLVEAGPTLAGTFINENLVDELWLYQAPVFLGSTGRPTAHLPLETMADKVQWKVLDRRQVGEDQRLILTRR